MGSESTWGILRHMVSFSLSRIPMDFHDGCKEHKHGVSGGRRTGRTGQVDDVISYRRRDQVTSNNR